MSVLDEIRTFEEKVVGRLRELEPLLREYEQLRALAQRLEISYTPGEAAAAPPAAAKRTGSARPGQRSDDLLRVVGEQPGITVREVGGQIGVDPTGLYRVANKLTADGRLRRDGPKLYPIESGAPAPRDDEAPADASAAPASADAPAAAAAKASTRKPAAKRAKPRTRKPAAATRRRTDGRSRPADELVMRIVGEEPGITVPGLSERLKVNRPDLYRVTTALTKQGRLRTEGPKLYLAETGATAP